MIGSIKSLVLMMVFSLVGIGAAEAHKVTIFAWAEGDTVYTQSKFSGGKRVKNGQIEVFDGEGTRLVEGHTDDNGQYAFKAPQITDLTLVLTAGTGHKNSWTLTAAELGQAPLDPVMPAQQRPRTPVKSASVREMSTADHGLTPQEIEAIVSRQLDQKLRPLTRMLAAAQDRGPSVGDILGGIGYILGLVGLGAYVRYRKERRRP